MVQVRARAAAAHPVVDLIYSALAALAAFESALFNPPAECQIAWTTQLADQVHLLLSSIPNFLDTV